MDLSQIAKELQLEKLTTHSTEGVDVEACHLGDMLSHVIASIKENSIWVTIQIHSNVVAIAILRSVAAIVFCAKRVPDDETLAKAEEEGIHCFSSELTAFQIASKLSESGIEG